MKILKWENSVRFFACFIIFSGLMWVLIPWSYYNSLHFDPAETLMWGSTFNLGNAKHPPMAGYMLYNFCRIFNFHSLSVFLLSQICVCGGLIYIYKLARCFFARRESVMAALLITFYFIYNYETPKFNANIPHILFIPMMCYYFYRGVTAGKWRYWLLLAVSSACAFLSKYYAGVLFVSFAGYIFCDRNARKTLATAKPYCAAVLFFILLIPHIRHLFATDFLVFDYISSGQEKQYGYFSQIAVVAAVIIAPLLCMSFAALLSWCIGRKMLPHGRLHTVNAAAAKYSFFIIGGQAAVLLLMALAGHRVESMWTFQMYFTAGIMVMAFFPEGVDRRTFRVFAGLAVVFAVMMMGMDLIYSNTKSSFRRHLKKEDFRTSAEIFYQKHTGSKNIPVITGDIWHAAMLQNAFKYTVPAAPDHDPLLLALHEKKIREQGAVVFTFAPGACGENIRKHLGVSVTGWEKHTFPYRARFGREKIHTVYFGVIRP